MVEYDQRTNERIFVNVVESQRTTQQAILDTAFSLLQRCGYHAFSYADIAAQVGIRKASIHYYFPGKNDLVRTVVVDYRTTARAGLEHLQRVIASLSGSLQPISPILERRLKVSHVFVSAPCLLPRF